MALVGAAQEGMASSFTGCAGARCGQLALWSAMTEPPKPKACLMPRACPWRCCETPTPYVWAQYIITCSFIFSSVACCLLRVPRSQTPARAGCGGAAAPCPLALHSLMLAQPDTSRPDRVVSSRHASSWDGPVQILGIWECQGGPVHQEGVERAGTLE